GTTETFIEYRPNAGVEKWFEQRFSAFSELKAWFAMTLAVLFFYFGGPGLILEGIINIFVGGVAGANTEAAAAMSQFILYIVYAVFGGIALAVTTGYSMQPTHLGVSYKGVRLYWKRWWGQAGGKLISWDA